MLTKKHLLLYALNFPDDGGYAILAADRRIDDEVLAVTEKGLSRVIILNHTAHTSQAMMMTFSKTNIMR